MSLQFNQNIKQVSKNLGFNLNGFKLFLTKGVISIQNQQGACGLSLSLLFQMRWVTKGMKQDKQQLLGLLLSFFPFFNSSPYSAGKGKKNEPSSQGAASSYGQEGKGLSSLSPLGGEGRSRKQSKDVEQKVVPTSAKKLRKTRVSNKNFEKISYEEIGLFPRSFSRVFDRFVKQLFYDVENLVVQEYRFYRYLFLTTVKCVFLFLFFPLFVNFLSKNYLVRPLTEYLWNTKQSQIFLNAYQQKHAFAELKYFEEKLYFESLVLPNLQTEQQSETELLSLSSPASSTPLLKRLAKQGKGEQGKERALSLHKKGEGDKGKGAAKEVEVGIQEKGNSTVQPKERFSSSNKEFSPFLLSVGSSNSRLSSASLPSLEEKGKKQGEEKNRIAALQLKTVQLAMTYNSQSIEAITNFFADLISVISFFYLLVAMEIPINISKSFLLEVFFGLDDSKKSLLILLVTDLLVGYHSDGPWAIFFESLFNHYGLPESQTGIFLLVATLPVLLDVLFKYLIFRHLNRASPATVATYHAMIE